MEGLTFKERFALTRDFRRGATVVFIGMVLYLALDYAISNLIAVFYFLSKGTGLESEQITSLLEADADGMGWITLASVAIAALVTWLYFAFKKNEASAFPGATEKQAVFGNNKPVNYKMIVFAMALILCVQLLFVIIFNGLELLFNMGGMTLEGSVALETDYSITASLILYACIIGPFVEELIFRGFVMKGLKQYGKSFAIITSSLCFALMHGDFRQSILTFFVGLIFGYVAMEYSIFWSTVLHIYNNMVLSELWVRFLELFPESTQGLIVCGTLAVLLAVFITLAVRNREKIKLWLAESRTPQGTYPRVWSSIIFILFVIHYTLTALGTINVLP